MTNLVTTMSVAPKTGAYACPMHPQVRQQAPGACSICGMALVRENAHYDLRPVFTAAIAVLGMIGMYFGVLTLVSGWSFTVSEFARFWPFVVALALGFGIQIGLYVYLKQTLAQHHAGGNMVVASGTTSTAAMLACCTHYLTNVLPLIGAAGLVTLVAEYQIELFWLGLAFNGAGMAFIGSRILQARRHA